MTLLKIVGSLSCASGGMRNHWGIRYRTNGAWTSLGQTNDFYNGTVLTQYQTVPDTCDLQVEACNSVYWAGIPWVFTVEIKGIGSASWYHGLLPSPLYACGSGMPIWLPKDAPLGSIDPSWAWSAIERKETIAITGDTSKELEEGGYSIFGYYIRRVRSRWDVILSSDHNIPKIILELCRDRVKEAEP